MTVYTTGEVSKLCNVAIRTVCKWTDDGSLKAFRIPGSGHRRIPHDSLVEFLLRKRLPLGELTVDIKISSLFLTQNKLLANSFKSTFSEAAFMEIAIVENSFDLATRVLERRPTFIILDYSFEPQRISELHKNLQSHPVTSGVSYVALLGSSDEVNLQKEKFVEVFKIPFDVTLLLARLKTVAGIED